MKYSIITINYNNKAGLVKTIESVINQTYPDFEYIVIDGGSSDGSLEVIQSYADRITYWVSERDKGIYDAMNKGVRAAHGEYYNFMNSGDCFYSNEVLEQCTQYLSSDIVQGESWNEGSDRNGWVYKDQHPDSLRFLYESSLAHQACFIHHSLFEKRMYDDSLRLVGDWKFFLESIIIDNCSFKNIPVKVSIFEGGGVSEKQKSKDLEERKLVISQLFPPRVIEHLERYKQKESPVLDLIPSFNKTVGLQNLIVRVIKIIVSIYNLFHRVK